MKTLMIVIGVAMVIGLFRWVILSLRRENCSCLEFMGDDEDCPIHGRRRR